MGNGAATAAAATQAREVGEPKGAERGKDGAKGGQQNAPPVRLSEAQRGASRGTTGAQTKHAPGDRGVASKPPGRGGAATPMKSAAAGSKYKPSTVSGWVRLPCSMPRAPCARTAQPALLGGARGLAGVPRCMRDKVTQHVSCLLSPCVA